MSKRVSKKDMILKESMQSFAKNGYVMTNLEDIAKRCGITKPAIYYHFKDKYALYEAVLCPMFEALVNKLLTIEDLEPIDAIKKYIEIFGQFIIENKHFSSILARELADGMQSIPQNCLKFSAKFIGVLSSAISKGVKSGKFKEQNPFLIQLMIVSTLINHQTTKDLRKRVLYECKKEIKYADATIEDLIPQLQDKIIKGLIS